MIVANVVGVNVVGTNVVAVVPPGAISLISSYKRRKFLLVVDLPSKNILSVEEAGTNEDDVMEVNVGLIVVVV